jgi:hypothetical protein
VNSVFTYVERLKTVPIPGVSIANPEPRDRKSGGEWAQSRERKNGRTVGVRLEADLS